MLVKQRMIFACDLSITLQFLIITYVEGRVLGAARSCWASLGPWCNLRDARVWCMVVEAIRIRVGTSLGLQLIKASFGCCRCHNIALSTLVSINAVVCR